MTAINSSFSTLLEKGNESLDRFSDGLSERFFIPSMIASYKLLGELTAISARTISYSLESRVRQVWSDPVSIRMAQRVTIPFEQITLYLGKRRPLNLPVVRYLDASLISSAQSLHRFTKEVNYLLMIPGTLRGMVTNLSLGRTLDQISLKLQKKSVVIDVVATRVKQVSLALVSMILRVFNAVLTFFLMENKFGTLSYIRQIIQVARSRIHTKFSEIASETIESQEKTIRKATVASIAEGATWWLTTTLTRIGLKTSLGALAYHATKSYLESNHKVPAAVVHAIALPVIGKVLWDHTFVPMLDPYFDNYDASYKGGESYLKDFLEYYELNTYYLPLFASRKIMYIAKE